MSKLQFQVWFLGFLFVWFRLAMSTPQETEVEINLCNLLKHTPNYAIYRLEDKSNCISHVKSFGKLICLRDGNNQVKEKMPVKVLFWTIPAKQEKLSTFEF